MQHFDEFYEPVANPLNEIELAKQAVYSQVRASSKGKVDRQGEYLPAKEMIFTQEALISS